MLKSVYRIAVCCSFAVAIPVKAEVSWTLGQASNMVDRAREYQLKQHDRDSEELTKLFDHVTIAIEDGNTTERVAAAYYYPTSESIQRYGYDSITFNPNTESLKILEAVTIRPDGQRITFDPATANTNDTNSYNTFSDAEQIIINSPGLVPGSSNVLVYEKRYFGEQPYYYDIPVGSTIEVNSLELSVTWQGEKPSISYPSESLNCTTASHRIDCSATDLAPVRLDSTDYALDVFPRLTVAPDKSWREAIDFMTQNINQASANKGDEFHQLMKEVGESDDPLKAALEIAGKGIRYASYSTGKNTHLPHSIEHTLNNRYGDCKDKSTLLLAMLRELGIPAYAALVATERTQPSSLTVPSIGYFDHMVVCADIDGERCFDPTDTYTGPATTPDWIQGKVRLNILPDAKPDVIPKAKYRWRFSTYSDLEFLDSGDQKETLTRVFNGEYAAWTRSSLAGLNTEEQEQWLAEVYTDTVGEPALQTVTVTNVGSLDPELRVEYSSQFNELAYPGEALDYEDRASWIWAFITSRTSDNEYRGFEFEGANFTSVYNVNTGDFWTDIETGPTVELSSRFGSFHRRYKMNAGNVQVETELRMPAQAISLDDIEGFNRFVELVAEETTFRLWGKPRT